MPTFYPYQQHGIEWLAARECALLADEPGVGKTAQAIGAADAADVRTALVLCPGIARENWRREFLRFQTTPRRVEVIRSAVDLNSVRAMCADVLVVAYSILTNEKARKFFAACTFDARICDEAHSLKEPKSLRSRAVYGSKFDRKTGLASRSKRVWLLTGTPMPNHPGEFWTHLRALWPEALEPICGTRRDSFLEHFCSFDPLTGRIVGPRRVPQLLELLRPRTLRPPAVRGPPRHAAAAVVVGIGSARRVAAAAARNGGSRGRLLKEDFAGGMESVVVFAQHRDVIAALAAGLPNCAVLSGDTRQADRQPIIDRFQAGEIQAVVCQLAVAQTAITLTRANQVVFAESSWVPSDMEQAAKRCCRLGQGRSVLARIVSLAGSIDEAVSDVLTRKMETIAKIDLASHNLVSA